MQGYVSWLLYVERYMHYLGVYGTFPESLVTDGMYQIQFKPH